MEKKVTFLRLVVHPGGPNGGQFPCYEHFETIENGVLYTFGRPECPTDVFTDRDIEYFNECPTKAKALSRLKKEKENKERDLAVIDSLIADIENGGDYETGHLTCDDDECDDDYDASQAASDDDECDD